VARAVAAQVVDWSLVTFREAVALPAHEWLWCYYAGLVAVSSSIRAPAGLAYVDTAASWLSSTIPSDRVIAAPGRPCVQW